jgi:Ca2+-binding RTX toxin-like protein
MATYIYGDADGDLYDKHASTESWMINSGAGDDTLWGGNAADALNGGLGNDHINGGGGNDGIRGGEGLDRVIGGAGNDNFIFASGDLITTAQGGGYCDHILDFHGAGNGYTAWTGAEDDMLAFFNMGAGHLDFVKDVGGNPSLQLYAVFNGEGALEGNVLVQMADGGTGHLGAGDYAFR